MGAFVKYLSASRQRSGNMSSLAARSPRESFASPVGEGGSSAMLLGRDDECARIDRLLDDATLGRGGVLVMAGEAGVGKSRLLAYAVERAADFRVLACNGLAGETHLAFSGLSDLLRPVLDELASLPEPQAAAVAGALALGPLPG